MLRMQLKGQQKKVCYTKWRNYSFLTKSKPLASMPRRSFPLHRRLIWQKWLRDDRVDESGTNIARALCCVLDTFPFRWDGKPAAGWSDPGVCLLVGFFVDTQEPRGDLIWQWGLFSTVLSELEILPSGACSGTGDDASVTPHQTSSLFLWLQLSSQHSALSRLQRPFPQPGTVS